MNQDFPRLLALARKERNLSQKQAANDLGVAQALLSHYEKGKRECGLDFLVRAADYYNVSTDYLLGRSALSNGAIITESDLPGAVDDKHADRGLGSLSAALTKKLLINGIEVIYSLLGQIKSQKLTQNISNLLSLSTYKAFRLIYKTNDKNDNNLFSISEESESSSTFASMLLSEGRALESIKSGEGERISISTTSIERDYNKQGTAILSLLMNCEAIIKDKK